MEINTINLASNSKMVFGSVNLKDWNNIETLKDDYITIKNQVDTFKLLLYLDSNILSVYEKEIALFMIDKRIHDLENYKEPDNHNKDC